MFGSDCVKVYQDFKVSDKLLIKGQETGSIYVMLAKDV